MKTPEHTLEGMHAEHATTSPHVSRARAPSLTRDSQGPMFGFYEREPVVEEDLMRLPHDLQVQ